MTLFWCVLLPPLPLTNTNTHFAWQGYVDPRAFVCCDQEGKQLWGTSGMAAINDVFTDIVLLLLTCMWALNGCFPGPYEACSTTLAGASAEQRDAIIQELGKQLQEWLPTLSVADPMFNGIRDSHPQLCNLIVRAFSGDTSERPLLQEWLQLSELASTRADVLQCVAAAMPDVLLQTTAIKQLQGMIDDSSAPVAAWQQWQDKQLALQKEREALWLDRLQRGLPVESPAEAEHREALLQQDRQRLMKDNQQLQQEKEELRERNAEMREAVRQLGRARGVDQQQLQDERQKRQQAEERAQQLQLQLEQMRFQLSQLQGMGGQG